MPSPRGLRHCLLAHWYYDLFIECIISRLVFFPNTERQKAHWLPQRWWTISKMRHIARSIEIVDKTADIDWRPYSCEWPKKNSKRPFTVNNSISCDCKPQQAIVPYHYSHQLDTQRSIKLLGQQQGEPKDPQCKASDSHSHHQIGAFQSNA